MPSEAKRRGITGTVVFKVTFDANGNFVKADKIGSSGASILDKAGYAVVSSQGGIENSTGQPVTIKVKVVYTFD